MSFTVSLSAPSSTFRDHPKFPYYPSPPPSTLQLTPCTRPYSLVDDPRNWISPDIRNNNALFDDDVDDEDRSLDLLVKLVQNVFRKLSKRATKALRSLLPPSISTNLVGFSVNGVLLLAFLCLLNAFLQVICTLGSAVFVSILLIRIIWSAVAYLQESHNLKANILDDDPRLWTGSQPAT